MRPDASYYNMQSTYLDLRANGGDLWSNINTANNLFLINTPTTGDFTVTMRLNSFVPTSYSNAPQFDILAYDNDDNHVRCSYGTFGPANNQRALEMVSESNGSPISSELLHDFGSSPFYLRLQKTGNVYAQYYSTDGTTYLPGSSSYTFGNGRPAKLGFVAMVDPYQSSHALIDYFEVSTADVSAWAVDANGNWSQAANWSGGTPNAAGRAPCWAMSLPLRTR